MGPAAIEESPTLAARWPDVRQVLDRQPWDSLAGCLLKAGANPEQTLPRLRRYCELLLQWNRKVSNLISRNDEPRIVPRHLQESLEPAHWLRSSGAGRWLDFGSGGGLPAIPLAIAGVGERWTLVESRRTKTLFMRKVLEELEMPNVDVVLARLEDLIEQPGHAYGYDGFTSRATLPLAPTLKMAASIVRPGGVAFLWKGSKRDEEMAADTAWQVNWDFNDLLGIGDGATAVARFTRK
ncbi:MAG TPA: 16S rRNA (guanine(527)-N(7))-methyltransferase RsmG [Candidatus Eisenbacteria bacterium]|jgi:16S rRNA (guanine527-N7)-methyltransferase